jgi:hypothetical protein
MPFNALETGTVLNFDSLDRRLRPIARQLFLSEESATASFVRFSKTYGLDLGDRWSFFCVLDEAGKIILEQKVATTPEAMKQTFGKIPRSLYFLS